MVFTVFVEFDYETFKISFILLKTMCVFGILERKENIKGLDMWNV